MEKLLKNDLLYVGLIVIMFLSIADVGLVGAKTVILINQNGEVENTNLIIRNGNYYELSGNISNPIVVERNNIVIDGKGYHLIGTNSGYAISLTTSNVTIKNFHIYEWEVGVLGPFNNNTIFNNFISNCSYGININADYYIIKENYLESNDKGIYLGRVSSYIQIIRNYITKNHYGLEVYSYASKGGIVITQNIITLNDLGLFVTWNMENLPQEIYQNNFNKNTQQVQTSEYSLIIQGKKPASTWNDGSQGNYWSDYHGTDLDNDGIGDTHYSITDYDFDIYPLLKPVDIETIPEFPSWIILPLFLTVSLVGLLIRKKWVGNK